MPRVCKFLNNIGDAITQCELISLLIQDYAQELYPKKKALGAIGGATTRGVIIFNPQTKVFTRIK